MAPRNIVLDSRHTAEKGQSAVSAIFNNVPLDTAVRLLADQSDLQAVLLDDVLVVTTKEQARSMQAEYERLRQKGMEFPPSFRSQPVGM